MSSASPQPLADVNGGPGGRLALPAGSPWGWSAKIDFWFRGPWRAPLALKAAGLYEAKTNRIQGIRTFCFTEGPIKKEIMKGTFIIKEGAHAPVM